MQHWDMYLQLIGRECDCCTKINFEIPDALYKEVMQAIRDGLPLKYCDFYPRLERCAMQSFDLDTYLAQAIDERPQREDFDDEDEYLREMEEYKAYLRHLRNGDGLEIITTIYDPGEAQRFKEYFTGRVFPEHGGFYDNKETFYLYGGADGDVSYDVSVLFDEVGTILDITDITSERYGCNDYYKCYPNYTELADLLTDELGEEG